MKKISLFLALLLCLIMISPVVAAPIGDTQPPVIVDVFNSMLQALLMYFLPILVAAAAGWVITQAKIAWSKFKASQPTWADYLHQAATVAVLAAEQAGIGKIVTDKKEYALGVAEAWLKKRGVILDLALIDAAIEAAVYEQFNASSDNKLGFALTQLPGN